MVPWEEKKISYPQHGPLEQVERDCTLIIHYTTLGTAPQVKDDAARILRYLEVRGVNPINATINGDLVEPAKFS